VTITDIFWTVGPYDLVTIIEAADDETASSGLLRLASQGNLRTHHDAGVQRRRGAARRREDQVAARGSVLAADPAFR
jgi:GYD domain